MVSGARWVAGEARRSRRVPPSRVPGAEEKVPLSPAEVAAYKEQLFWSSDRSTWPVNDREVTVVEG